MEVALTDSGTLSARARNRRASHAMLRERVLNTAEICFDRAGVTETTVDDIVNAAGMSRATFYRLFASRDEVVLAVLLREMDRITGHVLAELARYTTIEDVLTEGVLLCISTFRANPKLSMLFSPDAAALTARVAGDSDAVYARAHHVGRLVVESLPPEARRRLRPDVTIDEIGDHLVRTSLGFLVLPPAPNMRTEADRRRYVREFIVSAVLRPAEELDPDETAAGLSPPSGDHAVRS